ncbi:MmgE/PrpD family protein [Rhodococcus sp. 14C212]|uniref:MmgE/PrpD family protein n=1 Tax=Rhodococcus sp. 14C212 TaxID=2711209 RepID=UPI0013EB6790|nr:MmgE/PrpD family protein [Rhodococcus sp. 14C212]NGP07790.1 MmgE/PrpD family protein [Rhodococcus sp. 14C212]
MSTSTGDVAEVLAGHAVSQSFADLDDATVEAALEVLFDTLACALGGLHSPGVPEARTALSVWGSGAVTIWGTTDTAPGPFAAVANGGALHALDYDDTDDEVPLHAASVVLPALLADLEENRPDCGGHEFLTALVVGLDGAMRVGRAGGPKGSRGWNYSVVSGGMGAALAIARLRRWNVDQAVSLLGHQLAQTAGSLQSIIDGTLAKRFQPAVVAKNVLFGAALTGAGIDGPRNVFDGRAGFVNLYQDGKFDRDVLLEGADRAAYLTDLSLKPYPACRFTHAPIDLTLQIRDAGITPQSVEHITFETSGQAFNMVGRTYDPATANIVDAQFCIAYTASVALHRGAVLIGDFADGALRDPAVAGFAADKITVQPTDDVDFLAMAPVTAHVRLTDGTERTFVGKIVSGSPQHRLTPEQLKAKADDCVQHGGAAVTADELWNTVHALAKDEPVTRLLELLARPSKGPGSR